MSNSAELFNNWVGRLTPVELDKFVADGVAVLVLQCQDLYDSEPEFEAACRQLGSVKAMADVLHEEGQRRRNQFERLI
jgi:hypothetical protein